MVIQDIEKAYDTIWRNALMYKMSNQGIPEYKIKIIYSNLKETTIEVRIQDVTSMNHHQTRNFFHNKIRNDPFTQEIGPVNRDNTTFRKIRRLKYGRQ